MKYFNLKKIILITAFTLIIPFYSSAMSISVENKSGDAQIGDVVILDVYLTTDVSEEVNAIEGVIKVEGGQKIKQITTAGSVFDLWPNRPSYENSKISFVGGSAASVFGSKLKLFSIVVEIETNDKLNFIPEYINSYLNDGIGTKIGITEINTKVTFNEADRESKNEFEETLLNDRGAPKEFEVFVGQDDDTFDGKYFVSFNTTDNESGIERYEVIENDNKTPILTGTTYVLQDQSLKGSLIVKAFDYAGNVKVKEINIKDYAQVGRPINWFPLSIAIIILLIGFFAFKKFKTKKI
jgi:hypothetical protein